MLPAVNRRIIASAVAYLVFFAPAFAQDRSVPQGSVVRSIVVFAAASLKNALDAIGTQWTAETGNKISFSYAASGALAKQIENGAPADIFASADVRWMDYAAEKKLIQLDSRKSLLGNKLVLVAAKDDAPPLKIEKGFRLADALGESRLAIGDPKSVPAGGYAKAALTTLGVWESVSSKVAGAESVRAALAFVARGEAKLGIVYQTDATSEPKVKVVGVFPSDSHPPIIYPFALTAASSNPAAADFLAYLQSPAAAKIFAAEGFTVLP